MTTTKSNSDLMNLDLPEILSTNGGYYPPEDSGSGTGFPDLGDIIGDIVCW